MASVFSYDPDPPKLVSPWEDSLASSREDLPNHGDIQAPAMATKRPIQLGGMACPPPQLIESYNLSMLKEEPQDGPVEYKLHLLLRPRRSFSVMSTAAAMPRVRHAPSAWQSEAGTYDALPMAHLTFSMAVPTVQTRQNRLQGLTTQLLWRLQQSSPYHSQSAADLVVPRLPEATVTLGVPTRPDKLIPGLEDSRGALYEVGVTDDGALIGLSEDEMNESLTNLRAMAASLGCGVKILRCIIVGHCEWNDTVQSTSKQVTRKDELLVTEALVFPEASLKLTGLHDHLARSCSAPVLATTSPATAPASAPAAAEVSRTEQLRVSLTGRSAAGKSSLLGTLSTSTFDNGRGKSRLSLLKHRHEIATGMTSSVASELIGYAARRHETAADSKTVINYGCGNVASWDDIHNATGEGRLVFLTDSAGHLRYRRTAVRGLVSWAPHWTLCCIGANDEPQGNSSPRISAAEDTTSQDAAPGSSFAHLELCLQMQLSLVVIVTKHDRATREGLRHTLSVILSMIKAKDRKPILLVKPSATSGNHDLQSFSNGEQMEVLSALEDEPKAVPILLTSAVTGTGISKVHALLCNLPIPPLRGTRSPLSETLFHIDDVYVLNSRATIGSHAGDSDSTIVASGYLKHGTLTTGDHVQVGPFTIEQLAEPPKAPIMQRTRSNPSKGSSSPIPRLSQSMPRNENVRHFTPPPSTPTPVAFHGEFQAAQVVSLRNLRLPVRHLLADQAGTVGIRFTSGDRTLGAKLRKGMVILIREEAAVGGKLLPEMNGAAPHIPSYAAVRVRFGDEDYHVMEPGAPFNLYVASIRAASKIVTVEAVASGADTAPMDSDKSNGSLSTNGACGTSNNSSVLAQEISHSEAAGVLDEEQFEIEKSMDALSLASRDTIKPNGMIDVIFRFLYAPEWVEVGARVVAMPGQGTDGGGGLEGIVGHIVEAIE